MILNANVFHQQANNFDRRQSKCFFFLVFVWFSVIPFSFYRYDMKLDSYSSCQLTSVSSDKLDLSMDFQSDVDYDYYEKNLNASPSCRLMEFNNEYGQRRQWGFSGGDQNLLLWQDVNSLWNQPNEVRAYGDDRPSFGFDNRVRPGEPENDEQSLSIKHHGKTKFFHKGIRPSFTPSFTPTFSKGGGRQPVSPNG